MLMERPNRTLAAEGRYEKSDSYIHKKKTTDKLAN
jgi:hypothetical protein